MIDDEKIIEMFFGRSEQLTPTMTREDVLSLLGDTQDVGSGIYIYLYEVDQQYLLRIPFASDDAQLGVTGEDLLKAYF